MNNNQQHLLYRFWNTSLPSIILWLLPSYWTDYFLIILQSIFCKIPSIKSLNNYTTCLWFLEDTYFILIRLFFAKFYTYFLLTYLSLYAYLSCLLPTKNIYLFISPLFTKSFIIIRIGSKDFYFKLIFTLLVISYKIIKPTALLKRLVGIEGLR